MALTEKYFNYPTKEFKEELKEEGLLDYYLNIKNKMINFRDKLKLIAADLNKFKVKLKEIK